MQLLKFQMSRSLYDRNVAVVCISINNKRPKSIEIAHMALFTLIARPGRPLALRPHASNVIRHESEHGANMQTIASPVCKPNATKFNSIVSESLYESRFSPDLDQDRGGGVWEDRVLDSKDALGRG